MPLVRIALRRGRSADELSAIGNAIHRAMVETIDVPADDRFQIFSEHEASTLVFDANYLGIARSDDFIAIQISLRRGRSNEKKQVLYRRMVELLGQNVGIRPQDVLITLVENDLADWSFGNGEAQYLR